MPSLSFVLRRSKNFTSVAAVRMPPSVSFDHYLGSAWERESARERAHARPFERPAKSDRDPIPICHAVAFRR